MAPKIKDVDDNKDKPKPNTDKPNYDKDKAENGPDEEFLTGKKQEPDEGQDGDGGTGGDQGTEGQEDQGKEPDHEKETREAISGGEDSPEPEPKKTDDPDEQMDPRDAKIARLEKIVDDLSNSINTDIAENVSDRETKKEKEDRDETVGNLVDDLSDDEFDKITTSKEAFTQFLSKFGNNVIAKSSETTLRTVPDVINKSIKRQSKLKDAISRFYSNNPDLKSHSKYVGYIFSQQQDKNPDAKIDDLFESTEKEVRKNLQLNKTAVDRENERLKKQQNQNNRPVKPGSGRGARRTEGSDTRTDQQKQIDDILI